MKVINLHQEEKEIIKLAVENNRHAQQLIYTKFAPKMLSVCRQYVKDLHHAEDLMITAFMKVFINIKISSTKAVLKVGLEELWLMNVFRISEHKKVSFGRRKFCRKWV